MPSPFASFFGAGPEMHSPHKKEDEPDFYKILGISKDADDAAIRKAYRKLAMKYHPDRNKAPEAAEKFKEVGAAYEVLSDPQKRELYDKYGIEGLKEGGGFTNAEDLFSSLFGGSFGFGGGRSRGPRRPDDTVYEMGVGLPDLYNGKTKKLKVTHKIVCDGCGGKGSTKAGAETTCSSCQGRGVKIMIRQMGPGMIQQMQTVCPDCNGKGEVIDPKDRCKKCRGKKLRDKAEVIEVHIDKGMKDGQKLTFSEMGDHSPDGRPADLIIVLREAKAPGCKFTRRGQDLIYEQPLTLSQALTGYKFTITHMDGRVLVVSSESEVIKPGDVRVIENEGMPRYRSPFEKGKLFVKFDIIFPTVEDLAPIKSDLEKLLPPKPKVDIPKDAEVEEVSTSPFDPMDEENSREQARREAYEEDDDDERGARCVHQ